MTPSPAQVQVGLPAPRVGDVDVTLLYFDDCPSWRVTDEHLELICRDDPDVQLNRVVVDTPEGAELHRFRGSPSIHLDGEDLFADSDAPVGLSCRIYQTPDGPAGSPTLAQLTEAIESRTTA